MMQNPAALLRLQHEDDRMMREYEPEMKIAFDARMAFHSGIGTYIRGLFEGFGEIPAHEPVPSFLLLGAPDDFSPNSSLIEARQAYPAAIYSLREQFGFPLLHHAVDLIHFPHYNVPRRQLSVPFTVTIHDLIHLDTHHTLPFYKRYIAQSMLTHTASKACHIITVSHHSRDAIMNRLGVHENKITVIYEGVSKDFTTQSLEYRENVRRKHRLPELFLLAFGSDKPHKNLTSTILAFESFLKSSDIRVTLVIAGASATGPVAKQSRRSAFRDRIMILPHIKSRSELAAVVQMSKAVVFPSLLEGFGLPAVEAQSLGIPLLCSNATSLPEIAGNDAAMYFPPQDIEAQAQCMGCLFQLSDDAMRTLTESGLKNAGRFSWQQAARQTREIWEQVTESFMKKRPFNA